MATSTLDINNRMGYRAASAELGMLMSAMSSTDTSICSDVGKQGLLDMVRLAMARRIAKRSIFPPAVFRESCWDIMLICFVGEIENRHPCIKQIRNQLDESNTALLRRIDELEGTGLLKRHRDQVDGRRTTIRLTRDGIAAMTRFFAQIDGLA